MMEVKYFAAVFLMLGIFAVVCVSEGQQECQRGYQCFPGGRVPDDVTPEDISYYCCPEKNTTRHSNKTSDGTLNCTCVPDFTLDEKIQRWADNTKNDGRMCSRGAEACSGSRSNSTTNSRFLTCCWDVGGTQPVGTHVTIFDGDKEEYIGCRCNASIPSPDPQAYVVPQTSMYNSTGEDCAYDKGCDHRPALACKYSGVTFCCYGSRGIVTENDGDRLTKCTCTNQVYGQMCAGTPVPISQTTLPCLSECSGHDEEDVCGDNSGQERCCAHNMAVSVTLNNAGNFTQCTCSATGSKSCGDTTSAPGGDDTSSAPGLLQSSSLLLVLMACASLLEA